MKERIIVVFCLFVVIAIMCVPIPRSVFAFETHLPPPVVPQFLIDDLSLEIDNLNFSFPYCDTTLQIHIGSAEIKCCSEYIDENTTRAQIDLEARDFVMDGPISLKYDSLKLQLTITIYHADYDTHLYAEGSVVMSAWQYLQTLLSTLG